MAIIEIICSAVLSVFLTVPTMLVLYHKWIIPKILAGVKQDLPPAIITIVDEKITDFKEYISAQFDSARMALIGKIGGKNRAAKYAAQFLSQSGVTEETLDTVVSKYGKDVLQIIADKAANLNGSDSQPGPFGKISE